MTLDQIIAAERQADRAIRAIRPFLEKGPDKDAIDRADFILAEVRHFAVNWADIRAREDAIEVSGETATQERQAVIQRLTSSVAPQRF